MEHFNKLTPEEAERLAVLAEECAEVIQSIGKILRHGYESFDPSNPASTNRILLENEIGDTFVSVGLLLDSGDIDEGRMIKAQDNKRGRINKFLHHNKVKES